MSENKLENEINGNNVDFDVHNSNTENNNIDNSYGNAEPVALESNADPLPSPISDGIAEAYANQSNIEITDIADQDNSIEETTTAAIQDASTDAPVIATEQYCSTNEAAAVNMQDDSADADTFIKEQNDSADADTVVTAQGDSIEAAVTSEEQNAIFGKEEKFDEAEDLQNDFVLDGEATEDGVFEANETDDGENPDQIDIFDEYEESLCESTDNIDASDDNGYNTESEVEEFHEEKPRRKKEVGSRFVDSLFDFIELFIFSLAAVFIITTFILRHSVVNGSSMERTLFNGEHIIISDLFYTPKRGDIIVCEDYSTELPIPIVKRVIAIEGDRVEIDVFGNVKVNGELLDERDYVYIDPNFPYECDPLDIVVPEGELFVMGDHRNVSSDSRKIGTIKEDSILGKVLFRFYPFDKFGKVE